MTQNQPTLGDLKFAEALNAFVLAGQRLSEVWQHLDHTGAYYADGYPACLPSFPDFVSELQTWQDTALTAMALELEEPPLFPPAAVCECGCTGAQHKTVWEGNVFKGTRCEAHGGHKFAIAMPKL